MQQKNFQQLAINYRNQRTDENFRKLYDALYGPIKHYLTKFSNSITDIDVIEDLTSNVFVNIYSKFDTYDPEKG